MTSQMGSIADNQSGGYYFYRISKAALNMFNKSFSQDYPNIPSIVIHPGWVRTDMGGNHAPISPEIAAINISDLILTANNLSSGNFYNYKGKFCPGNLIFCCHLENNLVPTQPRQCKWIVVSCYLLWPSYFEILFSSQTFNSSVLFWIFASVVNPLKIITAARWASIFFNKMLLLLGTGN